MMRCRGLCYLPLLVALGCGSSPNARPERPLAALPTPEPAGPQDVWDRDPDQRVLTSRWYLTLDGQSLTLQLASDLDGTDLTGTVTGNDGVAETIDQIAWEATTGVLDFRRRLATGVSQWVHARAVEGVLTGRVGFGTIAEAPPKAPAAYAGHVVGWNEQYFSRDIVPRVFDVTVAGRSARLRLDRDAAGAIVGRFKVYADETHGNAAEEVEYDVDVQSWDGHALRFLRSSASWTETYEATVIGNSLVGTMSSSSDGASATLAGVRAELLGLGLAPRDAATRAEWQQRTRRQLAHLMMADNPAPLSLSVDREPIDLEPDGDGDFAPDRDDDVYDWDADYVVDELTLQTTLPNPYGGAPLMRALHGYVTTPSGSAPAGRWPAVVVLNGHDGSARRTLDPHDSMYWYGDAWARRGYVVLALDVGHRPLDARAALYGDYVDGDSPGDGNGTHPAIAADGLDSDWAEDGERAWDVERAVDYLSTLDSVDGGRILVTGLSMGAEVASFAGALDPRIAAVVPAGFVPDLTVMAQNGNHDCWNWLFGDPLDWFSVSDLHALVAPRPLVVETGVADGEFSRFSPPFVDAKEVARRSRAAYAADAAQLVLYLHPDGHDYRFGDTTPDGSDALFLAVPAVDGPRAPGDLTWAADATTISLGQTLAEWIAR